MNSSTKSTSHYSPDQQSTGFEYSSPSVVSPNSLNKPRTSSPITHQQHLSTLHASGDQTSKIHIDVSHNPSDKSFVLCDSSQASPRDLTDAGLSSLPPHKVSEYHLTSFSVLIDHLEKVIIFILFFIIKISKGDLDEGRSKINSLITNKAFYDEIQCKCS